MQTSIKVEVNQAAEYLLQTITRKYKYGIVLGTGISSLLEDVEVEYVFNYSDIPHFPVSTVQSHQSKLIFGLIGSTNVVIMAGRFHYYEGYDMDEVTFGIRVMKAIGIETLILTNVSGALNESFNAGDIAIIKDHINLHPVNPLRGPNDESMGPRFPDMSEAYDKRFRQIALPILKENNIPHHEVVYIGLQGPNLETPAESKYLKIIGGDIVGMSTVPEVIVARHLGLRCFAASIISNKCLGNENSEITTIESIIKVAKEAEPKLSFLIKEMLKRIGE